VSLFKQQKKSQAHPLAFSLADITLLGSKLYGLSAEATLKTCQSLYEKHKLTSYPRTDTGYLPESQFSDASDVLAALRQMLPDMQELIDGTDCTIKSRTWNDKKVTAHHGIIPTRHKGNLSALSDTESKLYALIVRRFVAQFYPNHEYMATTIDVRVAGETFRSSGKRILEPGWRTVLSNGHSDKEQALPKVKQGDDVICKKAARRDAATKPPARFNEGTLIQAMANIHRYIVLPDVLKSAVSTAVNERQLKEIENGKPKFDSFLRMHEAFIYEQVGAINSRAVTVEGAGHQQLGGKSENRKPRRQSEKGKSRRQSEHKCNNCSECLVRRPSTRRKGEWWWGCSGFPVCKATYRDKAGQPDLA